jgi:hypothetical protein
MKIKLLLVIVLISNSLMAQMEEIWVKEYTGEILWQRLTAAGNLLVSFSDQFARVDSETGTIIWRESKYAGLSESDFKELPSSFFFTITQGEDLLLLDQISGKVFFNSQNENLSEIEDYYMLYNSNLILVVGKNAENENVLIAVSMLNGEVLWRKDEKYGRIVDVTEIKDDRIIVSTLFKNISIDSQSGEINWSVANSKQSQDLGGLTGIMSSLADEIAGEDGIDVEVAFYMQEGASYFITANQVRNKSTKKDAENNETHTYSYSTSYMKYSVTDGTFLWDTPLKTSGLIGNVIFLESGIVLAPNLNLKEKQINGSPVSAGTGIRNLNLYDVESQEGKWGKKGRGLPTKGSVVQHVQMNDGLFLVFKDGDKYNLNFIDLKTQMFTFK